MREAELHRILPHESRTGAVPELSRGVVLLKSV